MTNKEVVKRLTNVHEALDDLHRTIEAIDISIFDLALEFAKKDDFPNIDIDEIKQEMKDFKERLFNDDCTCCGDCESCDDEIDEEKLMKCILPDIGDRVLIIHSHGIRESCPTWVFENIEDKSLVAKYAYEVDPDFIDISKPMTVVGYDSARDYYYVFDEEKDACYMVDSDYVAKHMTSDEAIDMFGKIL